MTNLISPESRFNRATCLSQTVYCDCLHCTRRGELRTLTEVANNCITRVQGRSRSSNWAPIPGAYATSYWWFILTLVVYLALEPRRFIGQKSPLVGPTLVSLNAIARCQSLSIRWWSLYRQKLQWCQWRRHRHICHSFDIITACDGQTDRRTDGLTDGHYCCSYDSAQHTA